MGDIKDSVVQQKVEIQEERLDVPSHHLNNKHGLALDIGGSLVKVAYSRRKDDDTSTVHFANFPRRSMEESLHEISAAFGDAMQSDTKIYATGTGSYTMRTFIENTLGKGLTEVNEFSCFVDGYKFLTNNFPIEDITHPLSEDAKEIAGVQIDLLTKMQKDTSDSSSKTQFFAKEKDDKKDEAASGGTRPTLLAMAGSGLGVIRINPDGSSNFVGGNAFCGKAFLGQGRLLTGAKTFEELMELASRGDRTNVSQYAGHMKQGNGGSAYMNLPDDCPMYYFGHAVDKDKSEFSHEDLAAALLNCICHVIGDTVNLHSMLHQAERVFFVGSFTGLCPLVRKQIDIFNVISSSLNPMGKLTEKYNMKYGAYLGVLGGLLQSTK